VTPLDRPRSLPDHLRRRGMALAETSVTMVFRGDAGAIRTNPDVQVRRAAPDDAMAFRDVLAGAANKWLRKLMLGSTVESMQHPGHAFYIGYAGGQPAGTVHLLIDHATAGLYAVHTSKPQRKTGVASTLLGAAITDAQAAGCDVIALRTDATGDARRLFAALGFQVAHENQLWVLPEAG
jgi:GNAT superfamily N-acetyltransferase